MKPVPKTVSSRDIQRSYRSIFDEVNETGEPAVVLKNSKPDVVIIPVKLFEALTPSSITKGEEIFYSTGVEDSSATGYVADTGADLRDIRNKSVKKKLDLSLCGIIEEDTRESVEIARKWRQKAWRREADDR